MLNCNAEFQKQNDRVPDVLISVILPVYNVEHELPACLESVIHQTYRNLEILLIDDGSTDNSRSICDAYSKKDDRCIVFHKKNGGLSDARNYGIARATGAYITCIDSDDSVDSDYVAYLYRLIADTGAGMSICQHRVVYSNGSVIEHGKTGSEVLSSKACIERMLYHDVIDTSAWGKLYDRRLFRTVQYPVGKIFEDMGTTYRLMLLCSKIAVGYESKYNYIRRETSITMRSFSEKKFDLLEMTDAMGKAVTAAYPDLSEAVLRRRMYARLYILNQLLHTPAYTQERKQIISFIRKNGKSVIKNPKAPGRNKAAIVLLSISYPLYRFAWLKFEKYFLNAR